MPKKRKENIALLAGSKALPASIKEKEIVGPKCHESPLPMGNWW